MNILPLSLCRGLCRVTSKTLQRGACGQFVGANFSNSHQGLSNIHLCSRYMVVNSTHSSRYLKKYEQNNRQSLALQCRYISEDKETRTVALWTNLKEVKSSPVPALLLGVSGLIPFIAVPTYMTMSMLYMPQVAFAQLAYAAATLSFVGGVRWGFVIPEESKHQPNWFNLGYGVALPLVGWVGLLLPNPLSLFTVMGGLAGAAYFDMVIPGYPPWFKGLRFLLSFVAVLSLWTTFMCRFFLETKKDKSDVEIEQGTVSIK